MPATQLSCGSTCLLVQLQTHLSISGTEDNGIRTATEFFVVKWSASTTAKQWPTTVDSETATDGTMTTPVRGTPHPFDTTRFASRIESRPANNDTHLIFQVRVEYTDSLDAVTSPLLAQPVIEWDTNASSQQPYFIDNNSSGGVPTVNTAGQRFSEFLQRFQGEVSATFSINLPITGSAAGYNSSTVVPYNASQTILYCAGGTNQSTPANNTDSFTFDGYTVSVGQALAKSCTCSGIQLQNGVKFRTKKWTIAFRQNGWKDYVENRGLQQLVAGVLAPLPSVNPAIGIPSAGFPLNINGTAMTTPTSIPPILTFTPYQQLAFTPLGFS